MTTKNEKEARSETLADSYPKLYQDISEEIIHLIEEIKYEINWLEQYCQEAFGTCESERHLRSLVELRNKLQKTRNEFRRESYSLSDSLGYIPFILGEVSQEELGW